MPAHSINPVVCRHLFCKALTLLLLCIPLHLVHAQTVLPDEACLLAALKSAAHDVTVGQLRQGCSPSAARPVPQTAPTEAQASTQTKPMPEEREPLPGEHSLINDRIRSELLAINQPFALLPHRPNYLLPLSHQKRDPASAATAGAYKATEAQFQMSFKIPLTEPLWNDQILPFFAYTGRAWWQVYDGERSRPFREYNHEPELMVAMPVSGAQAFGWKLRLVTLGFNHQSNGRSAPQSRSWNRLVGELHADHGTAYWSSLKLWKRLPEKAKLLPTDSDGDDNPDISRYLGNFEFKLGWVQPKGHQLTLTTRKSLNEGGKGALQIDWSHPISSTPALRWYVQGVKGYGDGLIDYNQKINRLGIGIMLNDWF